MILIPKNAWSTHLHSPVVYVFLNPLEHHDLYASLLSYYISTQITHVYPTTITTHILSLLDNLFSFMFITTSLLIYSYNENSLTFLTYSMISSIYLIIYVY